MTELPLARGTGLPDHEKVAASYLAVYQLIDSWGMRDGSEDMTKAAFNNYSRTFRGLGELSGYLRAQLSWEIPGVPRHLAGMLGGGLIGAGLGYGLGQLGSTLLPRRWDKKRMPRTLAMIGAELGAAPGLATLGFNAASGRGIGDDELLQMPPPDLARYQEKINVPSADGHKWWPVANPKYDPNMPGVLPSELEQIMKHGAIDEDVIHPVIKQAIAQTGCEETELPPISVDRSNHISQPGQRPAGEICSAAYSQQ